MSKKKSGRRVWRGVTTATASLLALSVCASTVVDGFRTDIDKFLGTKSTKLVTEDTDGVDLYTFKSDYTSTTDLLHGIQNVGERMSEEGSVLLKNNGALPLTKDETQKITLLGFSSYYPVQGGDMGSSLVENTGTDADTVDMVGAFKAKGFGLNQTVADMYEALKPTYKSEVQSWGGTVEYNHITAPSTTGVFSSKEPSQAAMDSQDAGWKDSMNDNNVMIVTIARSASENGSYNPGTAGVDPTQNLNQTDPLGLSDDERDLINAAVTAKAANGGKVIVLLNNASAMEVQEIEDNVGVDAILQVGLPGGYGFYGVADILSGAVSPSGHLTDTYAVKNASAPSAQNFGDLQWANANPDISMNDAIVEAENIYIGYKYYETRYFDTVMGQGNAASTVGSSTGSAWNYDDEVTYPFGYGLSYTTFEVETQKAWEEADSINVQVKVTNTGDMAGKEVVQLYYRAPQGLLKKPAKELGAFKKTRLLQPGESHTMVLTVTKEAMASYDDLGKVQASAYVLERGDYQFWLGTSVRDVREVSAVYTVAETIVVEQLESRCASNLLRERLRPDGTMEELPVDEAKVRISDWDPKQTPAKDPDVRAAQGSLFGVSERPVRLIDVAEGRATLGAFMEQLSVDDLISLLCGQPNTGVANTYGFGNLPEYGVPNIMTADGPAGLRIRPEVGVHTTAFPCATLLASTWNEALVEQVGAAGAAEVLENNIAVWLTPAMNIHRSPLCGRNFEYYSEDPLIAGKTGAAMVRGIQSRNVAASVKHFCCNNKETCRFESDSRVSERALREIYLKGFEIVVKEADPWTIMSSYNIVNGQRDSENKDLLTGILRDEWGFGGLVTTDWWNHAEQYLEIQAGNDVKMGCGYPERLKKDYEAGRITRDELVVSAKRVLELILKVD